jgi:zinc transporter
MEEFSDKKQGLICAYLLDGKGGGLPFTWEQMQNWTPEQQPGLLWININLSNLNAQKWIRDSSNLDNIAIDALLTKARTRPRSLTLDEGMLIILRGVNLKPGAEPDDLVSVRIWIENSRIITTQQYHVLSVNDLQAEIERGHGPTSQGDFIVRICTYLVERIADSIDEMNDNIDRFEANMLRQKRLNANLAELRRQIISLRRYLAPEREAMTRLQNEPVPWLTQDERQDLKEVTNRIVRYIEDLDAIRERATITQEELTNILIAQSNSRIYLLSLVAAIFLPLNFMTSLLGTNLAGIPWATSHWSFPVLAAILFTIGSVELWLLKRKRWL